MLKWNKKGLIFSPLERYDWMYSHAQIPFPVDFGNFIRVYFATREKYRGSQVKAYGGFVDLDKNNLKNILKVSDKPLIDLGGLGEFDEHGSMPCSVVKHNNVFYLYYVGWQRRVDVPYDWEIGLGISEDGETFKKIGKGPLLGATVEEPYLNSTPIVYKFSDTNWHMFYHTGKKWIKENGKVESQYVIKHAVSEDGINWKRNSKEVLPLLVENECQTSPSIFEKDGKYHMVFCYREGLDFRENRDKSYRIGYASSSDLFNWVRDDSQAGIDVSENGWDSQMIEYPHVTKINGKYIMFYCGNHFGKEGFGYAELAE